MLVVALVCAAVGYTIVRRSIGEPLNARDLLGAPVVLAAVGIHSLTEVPGLTAVDIGWLLGTGVVGLRALSTGVPFSVPRKEDQRGLPNRSDFERLDRQPALRDGVTWLSQRRA